MKLYDLIKGVAETGLPDTEITCITSDTRTEMKAGGMFVCIKGAVFDGHNAAAEMLEKGASVVVAERDLGLDRQIIVEDTRAAYPMLCSAWFGHPEKKAEACGSYRN